MDRITARLVTILSVLCIWLGSSPVEGKCRGQWASHHACLGGNGKRSDPSEQFQDNDSSRLLSKILRASAARPSESDDYEDGVMGVREKLAYNDQPVDYPTDNSVGLENLLREMIIHLQDKDRTKK